MSFTNVFGGGTLQSSDVSYRAIALAANTTLVWPLNSTTGTDFVAAINDVTPAGANLTITMPPANQVSTGEGALFRNLGASSFGVLDNGGTVIATVDASTARFIYNTSNTSVAGSWFSIVFGAGASSVDAASLAGSGMLAIGSTIAQGSVVNTFAANTSIQSSDRATIYIWTGGAGTLTLPLTSAVNIGVNFFFEVRNQGTGVLTVATSGGDVIDALSSIALQPSESCFVHSGSANWYSVGRGRSTQFNYTQVIKSVAGLGSPNYLNLTATECANVLQKYTGALAADLHVNFIPVVQIYYITNSSSAFNLIFQTSATNNATASGTTVTIAPSATAILFCDGTNVVNTSTTAGVPTNLSLTTLTVSGAATVGGTLGVTGVLTATGGVVGAVNGTVGATTPAAGTFTTVNEAVGANIASAATINLTTATGNLVHVTGTAAITAVTLGAGMRREVIFDGVLTLTHHATNNNLPGGANITTAAGDRALYTGDGTTVYCAHYQPASTLPITLGGTGGATAAAARAALSAAASGANADITSLAALTEPTGFRNKIIGGNFSTNPWQRGTTITNPATNAYTADMWQVVNSSAAAVDILRTADSPTAAQAGSYAKYCLHADVTTADAAIAAGDAYVIRQKIEGYITQPLGFGQAGTRYCTLSFWVKSTKTGIFCVAFTNAGGTRTYVAEYTILITDTWEYKTVAIAVDTAGTWEYDILCGCAVTFTLAAGATYQTTAGAWQTGNYYASASQVNALDSITNNFKLALVQLEAGSVATPFENRPIGTELALCQRYYETGQAYNYFGASNTGYAVAVDHFKVTKRATPTIVTLDSLSAPGKVSVITSQNGANTAGFASSDSQTDTAKVAYGYLATGTTNYGCIYSWTASADL